MLVEVNGQALTADQFSYDEQLNRVTLSDAYVATLDLLAGNIVVKIRYHQLNSGIN